MTTVTGPSGFMKSTFVKYVAQRFYERRYGGFKDGVLLIALEEKTSYI
jgi:hypothetical protein